MPLPTVRVLSLNFMCNLIEVEPGQREGQDLSARAQAEKLAKLEPDVVCAQEVTGRHLDLCAHLLGPECADRQIRFLGHPSLDTRQCLAVFSRWPINRECSTNLGPFQADGVEITPTHVGLGKRGLQAAILAAEIEHPIGKFWAVTGHFAWAPTAHEGLKPHQISALKRASEFLEELNSTGLPVILGADFNALLTECTKYLPSLRCLISQKLQREVGTSIDTPDQNQARRLVENGVYVDGVFASRQFVLEGDIEMITGLSDHKGHLMTLRRLP